MVIWRDKSGWAVDIANKESRQSSGIFEWEINPDHFDPAHLTPFRSLSPAGKNYVVIPNNKSSYERRHGKWKVEFISIRQIPDLKLK